MSDFKVGDKVEIVSNGYGHPYNIGSIVVISKVMGDSLYAKSHLDPEEGKGLYFYEHELKLITEESKKASEVQYGGSHYKNLKIQPMKYSLENNLNYAQANTVKYVTRYKDKNGIEDLKKAIHCIELLIEFEESKLDTKED